MKEGARCAQTRNTQSAAQTRSEKTHARPDENRALRNPNVRKGGGASFLKTKTLKSKNNVKDKSYVKNNAI